jgi:hypothetical protein
LSHWCSPSGIQHQHVVAGNTRSYHPSMMGVSSSPTPWLNQRAAPLQSTTREQLAPEQPAQSNQHRTGWKYYGQLSLFGNWVTGVLPVLSCLRRHKPASCPA